jgi:membrane-associated phospholipid phosphatase
VLIAIVCAILVVLVYEIFVGSFRGQVIDQSALEGAHIGRPRVIGAALSVLGLLSAVGIVLTTIGVVAVAAARRRLDLAIGAAAIVVGANVTSQLVKYQVFDRPQLGLDAGVHNTLPSGHATIAASLAAAAVLVVPPRARPWTAALGAAAAALTGVSTLVAGWHRPSDVVAATFVVGAWSGLVASVLDVRRVSRPRPAREPGSRAMAVVLALVGTVLVFPAAAAFRELRTLRGIASVHGDLLTAYLGGAAAIVASVALVFGFALAAFAGVGVDRPRRLRQGLVDGVNGVDGSVDGVDGVDGGAVGSVATGPARSSRAFASGA